MVRHLTCSICAKILDGCSWITLNASASHEPHIALVASPPTEVCQVSLCLLPVGILHASIARR